jgi:hypothetical protein
MQNLCWLLEAFIESDRVQPGATATADKHSAAEEFQVLQL